MGDVAGEHRAAPSRAGTASAAAAAIGEPHRAGWAEVAGYFWCVIAAMTSSSLRFSIYHGVMHIFARGSNNTIYHWWKNAGWHRQAITGAYSGNIDVFEFNDQLQTVGRGLDGNLHTIWYDRAMAYGTWRITTYP